MTPEATRIAIAEACGWQAPTINEPTITYDGSKESRRECYWTSPIGIHYQPCPDYLSDLNAMHEAENGLTGVQLVQYRRYLRDVCWAQGEDGDDEINLIRATAAQRAESFLHTLNLWRE